MQIKSLFFFFTLITIVTCFADETKKIFVVSPQAAHHNYINSEQRLSLSIPIGPVNISVDLVRSVFCIFKDWLRGSGKEKVHKPHSSQQACDVQKAVGYEVAVCKQKTESELQARAVIPQRVTAEQYGLDHVEREYGDASSVIPRSVIERRKQAIHDIAYRCKYERKNYQMSGYQQSMLQKHNCKPQNYSAGFGNQLQHVLYEECLALLEESSELGAKSNQQVMLVYATDTGHDLAIGGWVYKSMCMLDYCWAVVACAKGIVKGVAQGGVRAVKDAVHAVSHPVETVCDIGRFVVAAGYYLARATIVCGELSTNYFVNKVAFDERYDQIKSASLTLAASLYDTAMAMPVEEIACCAAQFLTHTIVTRKCNLALSKAFGSYTQIINNNLLAESFEKCRVVEKNILLPSIVEKNVHNSLLNAIILSFSSTCDQQKIFCLKYFYNLFLDIEKLESKYNGITKLLYPDGSKRPIKFNFLHIFGPEIKVVRKSSGKIIKKLSGLHHDLMGALEENNIFKITEKHVWKNSFYRYKPMWEEKKWPTKTFFPKKWSRELVVEKIIESLRGAIRSGERLVWDEHRYIINGRIGKDVHVRMVFNELGEMITAYPKILE